MNGLDNIIAKINSDCEAECEDILSKAKAEARAIIEKAEAEAALERKDILNNALRENERENELLNSRVELESKKNLLALKIELVNGIIEEALSKIKALPDGEYFKVIKSLVAKYAQKGTGTLQFSKKDLDRLPSGFEAELNKGLGADSSVTISSQPARIDGGFLLVYDNIDQNCSFEALLSSSVDEIKDKLFEMLFKGTDI